MTNQLTRPDNTRLPFFVYNFFNPYLNQLNDIDEIIDIYENECLVDKIVPITIKDFREKRKQAYLIYFNDNYCDDAYDIISKSQNNYFSQWKESKINDIRFNVLIKKNNAPTHENKYLELPDTKLPFFAYGVFKKGQLAHSRIKKFIYKEIEDNIPYKMGVRDGIPVLFYDKPGKTKGNLIFFNENDQEQAYKIICNTCAKVFYQWKETEVNGQLANVLIANNEKGISDIVYHNSYDGAKDIFFSEVIYFIEKQLNDSGGQSIGDFLNLQMAYLLLWVAIERFCILKYGLDGIYNNRQKFANEDKFAEHLKEIKRNNKSIFSAKDFEEHFLNINDPNSSIEYYYAIRCNVAHRGKNPKYVDFNSHNLIYSSLEELLGIFKEVLIDTFDKNIFKINSGVYNNKITNRYMK